MNFKIGDEYRISSDTHSWAVQRARRRMRRGKEVVEWDSVAWYGSFEQAVRCLGEAMIRESEAETLVEAMAEVARVCTALGQALPTHLCVVPRSEEA